jgi:hypothetical protein
MRRISLLVLGSFLVSGGASGQTAALTAAEMKALAGKGLSVTSTDLQGGKEFTGRIDLAANGKLSGTITVPGQAPIPVSGQWTLKGAQLCRTLEPVQPEEVCETWLKSGAKEVTVQVDGKSVSRNRWQ